MFGVYFSPQQRNIVCEYKLQRKPIPKQPPEVLSMKKGVLRNFTKFTGKHLC